MAQAHEVTPVSGDRPLEGIGGWLILMAIGQVVGPIQIVSGMIEEYSALPDGTVAMFPLAFFGDLALRLGWIGLLVYTAVLFFNKRADFPRMFIISYAVSLGLPLALALWVTLTSGVNTFVNFTGSVLGYWALAAAIGGLWVAYVLHSVRVRNTFVR